MTTCLRKTCLFALLYTFRVGVCQFMIGLLSFLDLTVGCGILLYLFLIIAFLITFYSELIFKCRPVSQALDFMIALTKSFQLSWQMPDGLLWLSLRTSTVGPLLLRCFRALAVGYSSFYILVMKLKIYIFCLDHLFFSRYLSGRPNKLTSMRTLIVAETQVKSSRVRPV